MILRDPRLRGDIDPLTPDDAAYVIRFRPEICDRIVGSEYLENSRISEKSGIGFARQPLYLSRSLKADVFSVSRQVLTIASMANFAFG